MASPMAAHFPAKPEFVQLTEWGTTRVPQGSSWMIFEVDSVAPSCAHPGAWVVHVRDYRYGADAAEAGGRSVLGDRTAFIFVLVCGLAAVGPVSAQQKSASQAGWISDESCGDQHAKPGRADCVKKCWRGGASVGHPE